MSTDKALDREDSGAFWRIPLHLWGPVFLLCTIALASVKAPLDLLAMALGGYYLCARLQMRGFAYTLVLLGVGAPLRHLFEVSDHLWSLGIEGSLACAFFITALAFEQTKSKTQSLADHIETGKASLQNIEEELSKERESAVANQVALQEKIDSLQKEFEEIQSEHSSILILNEVLRKTAAKHGEENGKIAHLALDLEHRIAVLQNELQQSQKELARVKGSDALVIENQKLMKELNAVRYEKEQTHLINETLARLHARENLKAREAAEKIDALAAEKKEMERRLLTELTASKSESKIFSDTHEQASRELERVRATLKELSGVNDQKNFLQERLRLAEEEISLLKQKASQPQSDPRSSEKIDSLHQERQQLTEQLSRALEKIQSLSQTETLFKQLKKQFEEKNQILHQTRSELFKTDTELQRLSMEKSQAGLQFNPIPKEVGEQMESLDAHLQQLEEENSHLQEIITSLSSSESSAPPARRKKK